MFHDELLISSCDLDKFVYDWEVEDLGIDEEPEISVEISQDSESSFDPMAAKIVDFQTRVYGKKLGIFPSGDHTCTL